MLAFNIEDFYTHYKDVSRELVEEAYADYLAANYCVATSAEADFFSLALTALNITDSDAVFVPDFPSDIYPAASNIFKVGVDTDFLMEPSSLVSTIEKVEFTTDLTPKAVIVSDTFGRPADFYNLKMIIRDAGMHLIEDARDCFGGGVDLTGDGLYKLAGTYGEIAFGPSAFFTEERKHYEKLREIAPSPDSNHLIHMRTELGALHGDRPLRRQIPDGSILLARHTVYETYEELLSDHARVLGFKLPSPAGENFLACTSFPLVLSEGLNTVKLNDLDEICPSKILCYGKKSILILPVDPCFERSDIEAICQRLIDCLR